MKKTISLITLLIVLITKVNSQNGWESVSSSPYEAFRFYNQANGMTAILDDTNNNLISYHSSAHSGLILRLKTNLNNISSIDSLGIGWIDQYSPMRGGGFDISKKNTTKFYLYGIGTRKNACYDYEGVTIFEQELDPTSSTNNKPRTTKRLNLTNTNSRQNNGVADNNGKYFFCNNGDNKKLYMIDMNSLSLDPVDISSLYNLPENYITKFKKITDIVQTDGSTNTHIIGLNDTSTHLTYIRIKNDGNTNPYTVARYKIDDIVSDLSNISILPHTFDLGINNGQAELLFFSLDNQNIYSVNLTANIGLTKNGKGNTVYNDLDPMNNTPLSRIRGLGYLENGSCLLFAYTNAETNTIPTNNNSHYYFDGVLEEQTGLGTLTRDCFDIPITISKDRRVGGKIVDKIFTFTTNTSNAIISSNVHNTKTFITRDIIDDAISNEEKRIRLYTMGNESPICSNISRADLNVYEPELNNFLTQNEFAKAGGHRIRSMAISNNHLLYDGMEFLNYRNLEDPQDPIESQNPDITDKDYLNLGTEVIEPISDNVFVAGLYLGAYLQRFEIINNEIIKRDRHKIIDDFNKMSSLTFDGERVFIGMYHNSFSDTNTSKIYTYNINDANNNSNNDEIANYPITNSIIEIPGTNHVKALKVINYDDKKWLYGIAENNTINTDDDPNINRHIIFRKNISDNNPTEFFTLPSSTINSPVKDMEIINSVAGTKTLYFITQESSTGSGKLFSMDVTDSNISISNNETSNSTNLNGLIELRNFNKLPMNLTAFLDKHLIISFKCGEIGYVNQDENNWVLSFDNIPLPSDFNEDVILANKEDKHLYVATREGVGITYANNKGGLVLKYELPSYLGFAYEFCYSNGSLTKEVLSGDFNNDGFDDLIQLTETTDNSGQLVWNIKANDQNNNFIDYSSYTWGPANADFVFVGDFNNDGFDDIGINNFSNPASVANGEWIIRLNDTFGSFVQQYRFKWLDLPNQPDKITVGDYNGDGFSDLAIFKENDGFYIKTNHALQNSVNFSSTTQYIDWGSSPDFIYSGDFNGDGLYDIGLKNTSTIGQWIVHFNDGMSNFDNQKRYIWEPNPDLITVGDYNNDGLADLCSFENSTNPEKWTFRLNYGYYKENTNSSENQRILNLETKNITPINLQNNSINIFPNPIKESLNLSYKTPFNVDIYDNYGRLIFQYNNQSKYKIDFKNLSTGIYFVKTKTMDFIKTYRVINK